LFYQSQVCCAPIIFFVFVVRWNKACNDYGGDLYEKRCPTILKIITLSDPEQYVFDDPDKEKDHHKKADRKHEYPIHGPPLTIANQINDKQDGA
jgi:hypothetical protein